MTTTDTSRGMAGTQTPGVTLELPAGADEEEVMKCLNAYLEDDRPPSKDTLALRMYGVRSRWAIERSQAILAWIKADRLDSGRADAVRSETAVVERAEERVEYVFNVDAFVAAHGATPEALRAARERQKQKQVWIRPTPYCEICEKRLLNGEGLLRDVFSNEGRKIGQARVHERCLTKTLARRYRPAAQKARVGVQSKAKKKSIRPLPVWGRAISQVRKKAKLR